MRPVHRWACDPVRTIRYKRPFLELLGKLNWVFLLLNMGVGKQRLEPCSLFANKKRSTMKKQLTHRGKHSWDTQKTNLDDIVSNCIKSQLKEALVLHHHFLGLRISYFSLSQLSSVLLPVTHRVPMAHGNLTATKRISGIYNALCYLRWTLCLLRICCDSSQTCLRQL